jgi:Domain of unknown function (DUF4845)
MNHQIQKTLLKSQKGFGALQWILILVIVSFFVLLGFRIIPLYAENQYVVAGLKDLLKLDEKLSELSDEEIRKRMFNFYVINGVRGEGPQKVVIEREDEDVLVKIDYDGVANIFTEQPFLGTVDVVVHFKNHLDSRYPRECCVPVKDK